MELESLNGNIIGVISSDYVDFPTGELVKDIVVKKPLEALKMVGLKSDVLEKKFSELSSRDKSKVMIASKLQDKVIILKNISKGLIKKDIDFLKILFKKIEKYNRKIILVDNNGYLFLDCVDKIYVINNSEIIFETEDFFSEELEKYIDLPEIVKFINLAAKKGIRLNHYVDLDELLKAIYRIKS